MKNNVFIFLVAALALMSCDNIKLSDREHDATLYGEWVQTDGGIYVHDYYRFYSDGTGIHGSYESDIDWVNEDEDIKWYTVDDRYLYVDGVKQEYWCNGSELEITKRGKTRHYREK